MAEAGRSGLEAFTLEPEERYMLVQMGRADKQPVTGEAAVQGVRNMVRMMLGDMACVSVDCVAADGNTFILRTSSRHVRAVWLACSCVEQLAGKPVALRVARVASTLVALAASSRPGMEPRPL